MASGHRTVYEASGAVAGVGIGFASLIAITAPKTTDVANDRWFQACVVIALLGSLTLLGALIHRGISWLLDRERPPQLPIATAPVAHPRSVPGRTYIKTSIRALNHIITSNTAPQAEMMIRPYIGKWLTVSGRLADVTPHQHPMGDPWYVVEFKVTGFLNRRPIQMNFEGEWGDYLKSVRRGTRMRVNGSIIRVPRWGIILGDCEPAR